MLQTTHPINIGLSRVTGTLCRHIPIWAEPCRYAGFECRTKSGLPSVCECSMWIDDKVQLPVFEIRYPAATRIPTRRHCTINLISMTLKTFSLRNLSFLQWIARKHLGSEFTTIEKLDNRRYTRHEIMSNRSIVTETNSYSISAKEISFWTRCT